MTRRMWVVVYPKGLPMVNTIAQTAALARAKVASRDVPWREWCNSGFTIQRCSVTVTLDRPPLPAAPPAPVL